MKVQGFAAVLISLFFSMGASAQTSTGAAQRAPGFNPDISMNALVLYRNSSRGNDLATAAEPSYAENGLSLQEAELQFASAVDPYWNLNGLFSIHQETSADGAGVKREWKFDPEEVFADTTSLPYVTLRFGKFKGAFGRHNQLHTHAFPFIDAPLVNQQLLGDEGLNDVGASASVLIPLPWFSEFALQEFSGRGEGVKDYYGSTSPNSTVTLGHFRNLWEVGEEATVEWGLSGATGKNSSDANTDLVGTDLTVKWRPAAYGSTRAFIWGTEAIQRALHQQATTEQGRGYFTYLQAQFATRWWVQGRGEYLERIDQGAALTSSFARKYSALIGYVPSEFSAIRLQYDQVYDGRQDAEKRVMAQLNFSIGAHPAHMY